MTGAHAEQNTIWFKPNIVAPQGFTIWAAGLVRKISIASKAEFLQSQRSYHLKQHTSDFLPLEKGKYQLFGKYDFNVQEGHELSMYLKADVPNDKYLLKYMRIKIVDKNESSRKHYS